MDAFHERNPGRKSSKQGKASCERKVPFLPWLLIELRLLFEEKKSCQLHGWQLCVQSNLGKLQF